MIVLLAIILGALAGLLHASRRKGNRLDKLQYMAVYALIFAIVALFVTIALEKML
ncbi:apolipoprotein acyltransferase [Vannielia litorea]|uniref:apolipoprotein acyltransferase n=1 Tax=Vannielia litorea TaxID=1217970 RepID=UPI001C95B42A|nr:apolipoprotein acyltransferase [Vannielia litorea]MBY6047563.1 apolipoprotein acyltransferase [Vannielia litorea]MBY6074977.1 apolipoprotein acyltransferase [Vannielia litorea]MBY6152501.1 apolipoprotein acyltransferase [Vannielia litorea]